MSGHPDLWRDVDGQPDAAALVASLEARGRTPSQARLRRRFLRFIPVHPGASVLDVGCGTGVVTRDAAALAGARGRVVGVDPSRAGLAVARGLAAAARSNGARGRGVAPIQYRRGVGTALPCPRDRFDVVLAVTVMLHLPDPAAVVREMVRVTRPGGRVALQDQDFGVVAAEHPDRDLTDRILVEVSRRVYPEPYSGRRLPGLLRAAGLTDVRLLTDVYQDTTLEPYTKTFLERRAERAVTLGLIDAATAQRWLDGFTARVAAGAFVFTMNYYGAVGTKPPHPGRRR